MSAERATLDDVEAAVLELTAYKPAAVIVAKTEKAPGAAAACARVLIT